MSRRLAFRRLWQSELVWDFRCAMIRMVNAWVNGGSVVKKMHNVLPHYCLCRSFAEARRWFQRKHEKSAELDRGDRKVRKLSFASPNPLSGQRGVKLSQTLPTNRHGQYSNNHKENGKNTNGGRISVFVELSSKQSTGSKSKTPACNR